MQRWNNPLDENRLRLNIKKIAYMECGLQTDGTTNVSDSKYDKMPGHLCQLAQVRPRTEKTLPAVHWAS
uniref:Uncharacterized protein n=1 Tax=Romanomermis culicivorax TaxID=13658 RepID=A0A915IYP4_ROMCU